MLLVAWPEGEEPCHSNEWDDDEGVHLIVHPLLALTADQVPKFRNGTHRFGPISAHNPGKLASGLSAYPYQARLIKYLLVIPPDTSRTVYVFVLPHFLAMHHNVHNTLLDCPRGCTVFSALMQQF